MKPEFTCHHCRWVLRANVGPAFVRGVLVGGLATVVAFGLAIWLIEAGGNVWWALIEGGGFIWLAVGAAAYRRSAVLTAIRPQRNLQAARSQ